MRKIKLDSKLNLNKTTISVLSNDEMKKANGGLWSAGRYCTNPCCCMNHRVTVGIFCNIYEEPYNI